MDTCDKEGKDPERYLKWADGYLVSLYFLVFNFTIPTDLLVSFNTGNLQYHTGVLKVSVIITTMHAYSIINRMVVQKHSGAVLIQPKGIWTESVSI